MSKKTHFTSVMNNALPEYTEEQRARIRKFSEYIEHLEYAGKHRKLFGGGDKD